MFKKGEGRLWALVSLFVLTLSGCGGGGLDDLFGDPEVELHAGDISTTTTSGTSGSISVSGEFSRVPDGTVYYDLVDSGNTFTTTWIDFNNGSGPKFSMTFHTYQNLTAGTHTGQLKVYFCKDTYCNKQWDGSPRTLNYVVTVNPDPNAPAVPPVTAQQTSLDFDVLAGQSVGSTLYSTLSCSLTGGYYVISDSNTLLLAQPASGYASTCGYFGVPLGPKVINAPGTYTGTLSIRVYADSAHATEYPGSPVQVPYSIVVH